MKTALGLLTALLISLAPRPAPAEEPAKLLAQAPSRYARMKDVRIHYKSLGRGATALVFIHGWTCDLTFWRAQVPAFAGKIRMVLIDLPGHGQSDKPKVAYTMDFFARSVDAVLQDAGVEHAVLVGHSMGTPVIRQYYRLFPKKTAALIVVDGALRLPNLKPEDFAKFVRLFEGADYKDNIGMMVDRMLTKQTPPEVGKAIKAVMQSAPQHVAVSAMKGMWDPAVWKDDPIKVPLLAVMARSPNWNANYEAHVRKLAPKVDYQVLEGVGHFLMLEKPAEVNRIMLRFLTKHGFVKG